MEYRLWKRLRIFLALILCMALPAGCAQAVMPQSQGTQTTVSQSRSAQMASAGQNDAEQTEASAGQNSERTEVSAGQNGTERTVVSAGQNGTEQTEVSAGQNGTEQTEVSAGQNDAERTADIREDGTYTSKDEVALYIHMYQKLPGNYITKKEARSLGWEGGSLEPYAPGKSIGGDTFGNYEGRLPEKKGRSYKECDIDTQGQKRGAKRIVYSDDGLIYYTDDHYETFTLLYGDVSE